MKSLTRTLSAGVAAIALSAGAAAAQHIVLVPQGQGPGGAQQFILVPVPQDEMQQGQQQDRGQQGQGQAEAGQGQMQGQGQQGQQAGAGNQKGSDQQGAGQQGAGQQQAARQQQMRDRAEATAMDLYRRGYQRGVADAQSSAGPQLDPAAMEQIGRELFERGYMLGMMQGRAQAAQQQAAATMPQGQQMAVQQQPDQQQSGKAQQGQQAGQSQQGQAQQGQQAQAGQAQSGQQLVQAQVGANSPDAMILAEKGQAAADHLVDRNGRAVYLFTADKRGKGDAQKAASNCYDNCATQWPPVLTQSSEVRGMGDVNAELLGTIERRDGTSQVTYNGWPLYYYVKDQGQDEAKGQDVQGFGGEWYLVTPSGKKAGEG